MPGPFSEYARLRVRPKAYEGAPQVRTVAELEDEADLVTTPTYHSVRLLSTICSVRGGARITGGGRFATSSGTSSLDGTRRQGRGVRRFSPSGRLFGNLGVQRLYPVCPMDRRRSLR